MRESAYNLCVLDSKRRCCLFNTRTGKIHVFSSGEYDDYLAAVNGTLPLESAAESLVRLAEGGFIVENEVDELAQIESAHASARTSREKLSLVIAPSMACNLDCAYCFEANRYPGRMSGETERSLIRFVRSCLEEGTRRLFVTWYGGEPLLAFRSICRLSEQFTALCNEFGAGYSADIVTNGVLMTPERARRLAGLKIVRAQITLDGVPELHDRRRVPKNKTPTFEKVLDGIDAAAEHMHVSVRVNACRSTAIRLEDLVRILAARGLNGKVSLYIAPLRQPPRSISTPAAVASGQSKRPGIMDRLDLLTGREAADLALEFDRLLRKYAFATSLTLLPQPRGHACIADQDHSWLIEANGELQKCDWTPGLSGEAVGALTPAGVAFRTPRQKWRDWDVFKHPECAACVMLPVCMGLCPLRKMNADTDSCPAFMHNWDRVLAQASGLAPDAVPAPPALIGAQLKKLALHDLASLAAHPRS